MAPPSQTRRPKAGYGGPVPQFEVSMNAIGMFVWPSLQNKDIGPRQSAPPRLVRRFKHMPATEMVKGRVCITKSATIGENQI